MKKKSKKHSFFRKNRIVRIEQNGVITMAKVVDSTISEKGFETSIKVGEMIDFVRNPNCDKTIKKRRVWWDHITTHDVSDTKYVALKLLNVPTTTDKLIYNYYR